MCSKPTRTLPPIHSCGRGPLPTSRHARDPCAKKIGVCAGSLVSDQVLLLCHQFLHQKPDPVCRPRRLQSFVRRSSQVSFTLLLLEGEVRLRVCSSLWVLSLINLSLLESNQRPELSSRCGAISSASAALNQAESSRPQTVEYSHWGINRRRWWQKGRGMGLNWPLRHFKKQAWSTNLHLSWKQPGISHSSTRKLSGALPLECSHLWVTVP